MKHLKYFESWENGFTIDAQGNITITNHDMIKPVNKIDSSKFSQKEASSIDNELYKTFGVDAYSIRSFFDDYLDKNQDINLSFIIKNKRSFIIRLSINRGLDHELFRSYRNDLVLKNKYKIDEKILNGLKSYLDQESLHIDDPDYEPTFLKKINGVSYYYEHCDINVYDKRKTDTYNKTQETIRRKKAEEKIRKRIEHEKYLKSLICDTCGGDGYIECDNCGATGYIDGEECEECYGDAAFICPDCGGSGQKD